MTRVALRGLAARKLRAFTTMLAVLLGVALVAGTYVLTDTITKSFDDIFEESLKGTDVSITPRQEVQSDQAPPPAFSAGLLPGSGVWTAWSPRPARSSRWRGS